MKFTSILTVAILVVSANLSFAKSSFCPKLQLTCSPITVNHTDGTLIYGTSISKRLVPVDGDEGVPSPINCEASVSVSGVRKNTKLVVTVMGTQDFTGFLHVANSDGGVIGTQTKVDNLNLEQALTLYDQSLEKRIQCSLEQINKPNSDY